MLDVGRYTIGTMKMGRRRFLKSLALAGAIATMGFSGCVEPEPTPASTPRQTPAPTSRPTPAPTRGRPRGVGRALGAANSLAGRSGARGGGGGGSEGHPEASSERVLQGLLPRLPEASKSMMTVPISGPQRGMGCGLEAHLLAGMCSGEGSSGLSARSMWGRE